MTFTEAAALVLRLVGKPLHYKEITDVAIEKNLLSHVGKSPEVTMGARLNALIKKSEKDNPLVRVKPGVFALREWDEATIEEGLKDRTPALERVNEEALRLVSEQEVATAVAQEQPLAFHAELDESATPPDEEEKHRAELSASATELFASEEDDDKPIFGEEEEEAESVLPLEEGEGESDSDRQGKRRRRRRRGRGRREDELLEGEDELDDDLPSYTVSDAAPEEVIVEIENEVVASGLESQLPEGGADLAQILEKALSTYERSRGPVPAQNLADALRRKWRADQGLHGAALLSVAQADNLRASQLGRLPRFRVIGNKLALTSWSLDKRSEEKQRAFLRAAEQLREGTLRALADQLAQLPHRAVGELVLVLLERMGMSRSQFVRRPGAHGSEIHLSAQLRLGGLETGALGACPGGLSQLRTAIVIRKDGRDIGRERVTELRGALHHYGPAAHGWLITTGQVLSGAKDEAGSSGASPVSLTGRYELAELCLLYGVGVRPLRVEVPTVDLELFEGLSGRS